LLNPDRLFIIAAVFDIDGKYLQYGNDSVVDELQTTNRG